MAAGRGGGGGEGAPAPRRERRRRDPPPEPEARVLAAARGGGVAEHGPRRTLRAEGPALGAAGTKGAVVRVSDQGRAQIARDEGGMRLQMYQDSRGVPTIGIGHNLRDKPIPHAAALLIFERDVADVEADLKRLLPWTEGVSHARYGAFANMLFNLGSGGLLTFVKMLLSAEAGLRQEAFEDVFASAYHAQVGPRAV